MLNIVMIGFVVERIMQATMLTIRHRVTMRIVVVKIAVVRSMAQILVMSRVILLSSKVAAEGTATQEDG